MKMLVAFVFLIWMINILGLVGYRNDILLQLGEWDPCMGIGNGSISFRVKLMQTKSLFLSCGILCSHVQPK